MAKPLMTSSTLAPIINALCGRLRAAVGSQSWSALSRIDAEIAQMLNGNPGIAVSIADRALVEQLRQAHQQAVDACEREVQRLDQVLKTMRENRDGWQAYVESQAWNLQVVTEVQG